MNYKFKSAAIISLLLSMNTPAQAQDYQAMMQQNMMQQQALQNQMMQQIQQAQRNAMQEEQKYIQQNRPQLEKEHQQFMQSTGMQMPLEAYVHNKIMEEAARRHNAANVNSGSNPMFEQQKRMFEAGQQAHQARQQNYAAQNQNWAQSQQQIEKNNQAWNQQQRQIDSSHSRFIQQGIQGNQYYKNSETGQVAELPFAGDTGVYQNNDNTWSSEAMGQFKQIDPNGNAQQMEAYEPEYYGED